jgi:hypothetical protein
MQAGDILFIKGKSFISNLIKEVDKGDFSHVAIAVSETEVFEAQFYTRARITKMTYEDFEVIQLGISKLEQEKIQAICQVLQGTWYDYLQVTSYIFKRLVKRVPYNSPNNLICSESISFILYVLDKIPSFNPDITPNELYKVLKKMPRTDRG